MIIVGFPGIGKTSVCQNSYQGNGFIDLDSSSFDLTKPDGIRCYVNIAETLSDQGYHVFISSHEAVRRRLKEIYLNKKNDPRYRIPMIVGLVYPVLDLKNIWCRKLSERVLNDPSDKNVRAFIKCVREYDNMITGLERESEPFMKMPIKSIDYELLEHLEKFDIRQHMEALPSEE